MKKVLFSLMAAAAMLFVSSCAKETPVAGVEGETVEISLDFALENAPQTRAIADGKSVNHLTYSLFKKDVTTKEPVLVTTFGEGGQVSKEFAFPGTEKISLAKGQEYVLVFWADVADNTFYKLDKSMNLTVDYTGINNNENRDAFCKVVELPKLANNLSVDVYLTRPFAQLNVGASQDDWNKAVAAGIDITTSKVTLGGVVNSFDILNNEVTGLTTVTYSANTIPSKLTPAENLSVDADGDGNKEAYVWLSMSYILPAHKENSTVLEDLQFEFATEKGEKIVLKEGLSNVPVQRNWRTNIVGRFLTGDVEFNIHIDPDFINDHNVVIPTQPVEEGENGVYEVTNENELLWIAEQLEGGSTLAGKTVKLMNDLNMEDVAWTPLNLWGPEGKTLAEIDGNGFAIKGLTLEGAGSLGFIGSYASSSVLTIKNLTFENPVVKSTSSFVGTVVGYTYGNITLDNVKVTGAEISTSAEKGIRLGGLVGLYPADAVQPLVLNKCVVENSSITGYHNLAGLVGSTMGSKATMTDCHSNNNTFYHRATNAAAWQNYDANGYAAGKAVKTGCTTTGNKGINAVADGVVLNAAGEYEISSAAGMTWFADQVNVAGNNFAGKTVKLAQTVDLNNEPWTPIGQTGATEFKGVFDGQGNDIKNLYIKNTDASASCATGLFGWIESHGNEGVTVKNLNVQGAKVYGHHNVAVIAGYIYGTIEYCSVYDAVVECVSVNDDANGDKCGAIAGYVGEDASINYNVVSGAVISAGRDAGQVVGAAKEACVKGNKANGVTVKANGTSTGANIREEIIGRVL